MTQIIMTQPTICVVDIGNTGSCELVLDVPNLSGRIPNRSELTPNPLNTIISTDLTFSMRQPRHRTWSGTVLFTLPGDLVQHGPKSSDLNK